MVRSPSKLRITFFLILARLDIFASFFQVFLVKKKRKKQLLFKRNYMIQSDKL